MRPLTIAGTGSAPTLWRKSKLSLNKRAQELGRNTLVVFDIDNTLLTMKQDLGGDAWYNWQRDLLKGPPSNFSVAKDGRGLLDVQRLLYDVGSMEPPEPWTPLFVAELRNKKYPIMMLTSRGPAALSATRRELVNNKYIAEDASPCEADSSCAPPPECGASLCATPGIISATEIDRLLIMQRSVSPGAHSAPSKGLSVIGTA
jgi:hypothetical protein